MNTIKSRKFWNVVTMNGPDDDSCTVTFDSVVEAMRYFNWARQQGFWFLTMWK